MPARLWEDNMNTTFYHIRKPIITTDKHEKASDSYLTAAGHHGTGTTDTIVYDREEWKGVVIAVNNLRWLSVTTDAVPGRHTLRLIMIDPEIVVEQLVINPDNARYSYFGAPAR